MVNRIVVGAHYGLKDWLIQRITAVLIVIYTIIVTALLLIRLPVGYEEWKAVFAPQWFRIFTLVFLLAVFWHAWVGMRDILMDYIKSTGIRLGLQVLVVIALIAYSFWSLMILWSI